MRIKVRVFYPELREALGEAEDIWAEGATVGECLGDLVGRHPDVRGLLFNGHDVLHRRVYVYVNAEGMRKAEMTQPVREGDTLIVAVLASGG